MIRKVLLYPLFGLFIGLATPTPAAELAPLELLQVHACRATGSLLLFRGEGFQEAHANRMQADLQAMDRAFHDIAEPSAALRSSRDILVTQLQRGVSFGHKEEDVPWRYPQELAKALRDVLIAARAQSGPVGTEELPAKVEYLNVQYLSRAYIGTFEIAREDGDSYVGQDERRLLPDIDQELVPLDDKADPALAKLKTRWGFLRAALSDLNSQSNALVSASGRPYAPVVVDRHARSMSGQLLAQGKSASPVSP
ncbi:hypothetical protein [Metapseudomonas resinovorans]|uniref:Uncharacterized protein n=1 Tax=Metapseudomonas resinovorans NBRC 106553 TaxID=1245471 RepID=S6B9W7_METRE|nr:hypothetical protein [Pseudomonas resinovorans]BAN45869.1 hypothetical protein PCA10_01370 [Pseudomonas resinovorans NBRC 106553]